MESDGDTRAGECAKSDERADAKWKRLASSVKSIVAQLIINFCISWSLGAQYPRFKIRPIRHAM